MTQANAQTKASLYEALALFEQRLSKVQPGASLKGGPGVRPANSGVAEGPPPVN
jgi:hypothetical protein